MPLGDAPREDTVDPPARVLIVDDEPQVLVALEDVLGSSFNVMATDEPARALKLAEQNPDIAVVLSDQRMPQMTGDELFRQLQDRSNAARILCTGFADLQAVVRSVNEGKIFAYVTKPWESSDLRLKVQHAAEYFRLHRELANEKQLFGDLMRSIPEAIFFKDPDSRYVRVNRAFLELVGLSEDQVLGKRLQELNFNGKVADEVTRIEQRLASEGVARRDVLHFQTPRGVPVAMSTTRALVRSPDGRVLGLVGIAQDISEAVRTESALRASEERLRLAFLASNSGLFDWNLETGETQYSPSSTLEQSGATASHDFEALERRVHPDDVRRLRDALNAHFEQREPLRGLQLRAKNDNDEYRWLEISAQAAWNAAGKAVRLVGATLDITERKELDTRVSQLDYRARHDDVTDLPNRSQFELELGRAIASAQATAERLSVVAFNIVRFRHVNESLGRSSGDRLLREVASRLSALLGPGDLAARFQADTFAVAVRAAQATQVAQWVEQTLLPTLGRTISLEDGDLTLSIKAGVAQFPGDADQVDALIANAETALKQAKHGPQSYLFYVPSMNARVTERLRLEGKLRRALTNDEFLLYYQPKIDLKTGEMVGMEALIRWRDPEQGLVPPGSFIPLLEETELILPVGRWVLERAARQYIEWSERKLTAPRIAVNVSALQLAQRDFVGVLEATLDKYPGAAGGLDLELTESVLMDDLAGNIEKLRAAQQQGLKVAIDDFGTGYSSLGYLSRLPLDALKVDRSFIEHMAEDPQQMSIVTAIISLAHSLDLKVIAEGVETAVQAQLLRLLRCDQIQGYLMARPQPADEVSRLFGKKLEVPRTANH